MKETVRSSIRVSVALTALWLSACGGGGGDDVIVGNPSSGGTGAPAAGPGSATGGSGGTDTAQAPGTASVPAPAPAPAASTAIGVNWTATGPQDVWHSLSSSADGQVMVAGQAQAGSLGNSLLSVSTDGGQTWTERSALGGGIWISSDVSSDGNHIAAVNLEGTMVLSRDRGATFAAVPLPTGLTSPDFESVTLSGDGTRIAAVPMHGPLIVGTVATDGTVTWLTTTGLPATAGWRSIDSSSNGQVLVAVAEDPASFISTDGGVTWTALPVAIGSPATPVVDQNWYRVKVSGDGNTIVIVANAFGGSSGNGIYVSRDRGATFTRPFALETDYTSIATSADGGVIAVTHSDNESASGAGQLLMSTNGGASFAPVAVNVGGTPVPNENWRAVAMSADATRMAAARGRFVDNATGQIYVSSGTRPAAAPAPAPAPATPPATGPATSPATPPATPPATAPATPAATGPTTPPAAGPTTPSPATGPTTPPAAGPATPPPAPPATTSTTQ